MYAETSRRCHTHGLVCLSLSSSPIHHHRRRLHLLLLFFYTRHNKMRVSPLNHTTRNYTKPKFTCRCSFHGNAASFKGMELLLGREQIVPHLVEAGPCAPKHPVLLLLLLEPFPIQTRPLARIGGHACKLSRAESLFLSENDSVRSQKGLKDVTLNMADPDRCFPSRSSGASGLDVFGSVSRS